MLGGESGFKKLIEKSNSLGIKILIDSLTRVSSARPHRKYRKLIIHRIDHEGKKLAVYGSDGRAVNFEDTALLNYRKKKVWDLLVEEIIFMATKYGIHGIHLDNGQAWPQILNCNLAEMYRKDPDGKYAYTDKEIFEGEIVNEDEESGFWSCSLK